MNLEIAHEVHALDIVDACPAARSMLGIGARVSAHGAASSQPGGVAVAPWTRQQLTGEQRKAQNPQDPG